MLFLGLLPETRHRHSKIQKNPRQTKKHGVGGEARADTEQRERKNAVVPDSILERTLGCDGIRRGAYDYISHHHTLRACDIITYRFWKQVLIW